MKTETTLKNYLFERQLFLGRAVVTLVLVGVLMLGLVARLVYLQVIGHQYYAKLSQHNSVKIESLPPTRGLIYDRNGVLLANNIPTYVLEVVPEQVAKSGDLNQTLTELQQLFSLPDKKIARFHRLRKQQPSFATIPLYMHLSDEEVARFAVNRQRFPGVDIAARLIRHYPYKALTSHVIGYVGRINKAELQRINEVDYRGTTHIGKIGIERAYEDLLHGKAGFKEVETNARGRRLGVLKRHESITGSDLYLTLDIQLQQVALDALGDYKGAIVAMDPNNGDILAMVSKPGYDPNLFVNGISFKDYKALNQSEDRPLYDRALRGEYPPGSTVKPFVALAGLETGVITPQHSSYCPGFYRIKGSKHRYRCWKKRGHGHVDMKKAIAESCDVYFYSLAQSLKIDRLHDYLVQFGFGTKTGIDLLGERRGIMPSTRWKQKRYKKPWYPGETLIAGIGQGFVTVTPLQLAVATATIATRGVRMEPRLMYATADAGKKQFTLQPPKIKQIVPKVSAENWQQVVDAMKEVIHGRRGTARLISKGATYKMAGKTGTAQVFTIKQNENYNEDEVSEKLRDHALFVAFAPLSSPKIAVAIIVENGGHGNRVAAPIARQLFDQYLKHNQNDT